MEILKNQQLIYSCFLQLSANFHVLSDKHDVTECGFHERKEKSCVYTLTRVGGRNTLACTFTRACIRMWVRQHTHARANLRSNARVSQSRIADFSHTFLRHDSLFCSPSRPTLSRPNPYHRPLHTLLAPISFSHYSFSFSNEQRYIIVVCHIWHYDFE